MSAEVVMPLSPEEVERALKIAREMVDAGIPIFSAAPDSGRPGEYHLPKAWQDTRARLDDGTPNYSGIERWRPGWALGAVGGHAADFLDNDPRSGGRESVRELELQGQMPRTFGRAETPSGGDHRILSPTGERKSTGFMPGLDLQSGGARPDEHGTYGRGFVFLSPTVRPSKAPETLGQLRPYRWVETPDLEHLSEWSGGDDSLEGLIARVHSYRSRGNTGAGVSPFATPGTISAAPGGPFAVPSQTVTRAFTPDQAREFCEPVLTALAAAQVGGIEDACNNAAAQLYHFVPALLSVDGAMQLLRERLASTAYDERHPASRWTVEKFRAVLDGRRPPADRWKAALASWPEAPARPTGRLRKAMYRRSEINELPDPVPLIEHVLFRNTVTVLAGKFGTYKSFIAVSWASCLATGREWFGFRVPEPVRVIYAAAEGAAGIKRRLNAWEKAHGVIVPDDLYLISVSVRLNRPEDLAELEELIQETRADVLIFDTFHASTPGVDENDNGEIGNIFDTLRGLSEKHGVATILPHHTGHAGERSRGGSSIEDDADVSFVIKLKGEDRGPDSVRTMTHRKTKDEALLPDMELALELVNGTGSGHVVHVDDAFRDAEVAVVRPGQEQVIPEPADWTREVTKPDAHLQRQILQVLASVAGVVGMTEAATRVAMINRWYPGGLGRGADKLRKDAYEKAWRALHEVTHNGEPVICAGEGGAKSMIINPEADVTGQ